MKRGRCWFVMPFTWRNHCETYIYSLLKGDGGLKRKETVFVCSTGKRVRPCIYSRDLLGLHNLQAWQVFKWFIVAVYCLSSHSAHSVAFDPSHSAFMYVPDDESWENRDIRTNQMSCKYSLRRTLKSWVFTQNRYTVQSVPWFAQSYEEVCYTRRKET